MADKMNTIREWERRAQRATRAGNAVLAAALRARANRARHARMTSELASSAEIAARLRRVTS